MIDITKEEFWDNKYEEVSKAKKEQNKLKDFILTHKFFTTLLISLGILMTINTVLICNFLKILNEL